MQRFSALCTTESRLQSKFQHFGTILCPQVTRRRRWPGSQLRGHSQLIISPSHGTGLSMANLYIIMKWFNGCCEINPICSGYLR